jgi:hypothetical protein
VCDAQVDDHQNPYFGLEQTAPSRFMWVISTARKIEQQRIHRCRKKRFIVSGFPRVQFRVLLSTLKDSLTPYANARGLKLHFSGRYAADVEKQKRLADDINQSTTITLLILAASLIIFFRSLRVILVIGLPVIAALGYTYFTAWYFMGQISIISSFLTAILLGLGVDYGIHLRQRRTGSTA